MDPEESGCEICFAKAESAVSPTGVEGGHAVGDGAGLYQGCGEVSKGMTALDLIDKAIDCRRWRGRSSEDRSAACRTGENERAASASGSLDKLGFAGRLWVFRVLIEGEFEKVDVSVAVRIPIPCKGGVAGPIHREMLVSPCGECMCGVMDLYFPDRGGVGGGIDEQADLGGCLL